MFELGNTGDIAGNAPFWSGIRSFLSRSPEVSFNSGFYILMAPVLQEADRSWIQALLARGGGNLATVEPQRSFLYWIATDWLLVYGRPADWDTFRKSMTPLHWEGALDTLRSRLERLPAYWASEPSVQSMFCDGEREESFWEHPDACLAAWGVTREALVVFGFEKVKVKGYLKMLQYPSEALKMGYSTTLTLRLICGADGKVRWARPQPGYALAYFVPTGIEHALWLPYEPARVAGVAKPSQFTLTMPFKLLQD